MKLFIRNIFLGIIAFSSPYISSAQDSSNVYTYGGTNNDYAREIICTSDSGFIVVGTTSSFDVALTDIYIIKTDRNGVKQWSHLYGSEAIDWAYGVRETFDHGYVVVGYTNRNTLSGYDIYLLKINSIGEVQWEKTIGGPDWDFGYAIETTPDSGFIICGKSYSFSNGGTDAFITKVDSTGNFVWQKNYGGAGDESLNDIIRDQDNNYGLVGVTSTYGAGREDEWLLRIDGNGDTLWTKTYGDLLFDAGYSIDTTADGGYVTAGTTNSYGGTDTTKNIMLIKTNQAGYWMFTSMHGKADATEEGYIVDVFPDGEIFDGGITDGFGDGKTAFYMLRNDSIGQYIEGANFGGTEHEEGYSVAVGKDNQIMFAGITDSYGCGQFDVYLIRIDTYLFQHQHPPIYHVTCDTTIGIPEQEIENRNISVYPNPSSEKVTVDFSPDQSLRGKCEIAITDLSGKKIKLESVERFPVEINIQSLTSGFYLLNIYNESILRSTTKLIVY
jgi:hypothetical protein